MSRSRASTSCSCRRPLIVVATLCFICALQAAKKGAQRARRDAKPVEYRPLYSATFRAEMQLENSFSVAAPPSRVFAYLLDVNKIVGCGPGAELSEVVDPTTFKVKEKIKVGPITVAYSGTARIANREDAKHAATHDPEGRVPTGPGSVRSRA